MHSKNATSKSKANNVVGIGFNMRVAVWALLIVFGWRALALMAQSLNRPAIVSGLASVRQYAQDIVPNHANTCMVFCQETEEGVGIYYFDMALAAPRLLCELKEAAHRWQRFTMFDWTLDDKFFACAYPDARQNAEFILIFDGVTGILLDKVKVDDNLYQFGWLSDDRFAYSTRTTIQVVNRTPNGGWTYERSFENVAKAMDNFVPISSSAVAWRDENGIWLLDINSASPQRIWEATTNGLVEFTYSSSANRLSLNCNDDRGQYLLVADPGANQIWNAGRLGNQQDYIRNVVWSERGSGYAYLTNDLAGAAICAKTEEMDSPVTIPWHGGIRTITLNGDRIYFSGNAEDKPPGIWECDIRSGNFHSLLGAERHALRYTINSPSSSHVLTNSLGEERFYHIWLPPAASHIRKFPLLLGQELNTWFPWFQMAAHSGYCVAIVDRPFCHTWNGKHEHTWMEDVHSLYETMASNPDIDTNQVFLYGCSAETSYLSRFMEEYPNIAKGAVLFSPTILPDVRSLKNKHMLLVDGMADGDAPLRLAKYQDSAMLTGNKVAVYLEKGAGHNTASGSSERNRAMQVAAFLSEER